MIQTTFKKTRIGQRKMTQFLIQFREVSDKAILTLIFITVACLCIDENFRNNYAMYFVAVFTPVAVLNMLASMLTVDHQ